MKLVNCTSKRVKDLCKKYGISQYGLFKRSGVPQSTISTIIKGETKTVKLSTIYDICSGLNIELSEFFDTDYFKLENLDD